FWRDRLAQADLRDVVRDATELRDEEARNQQRQRERLRSERYEDLRAREEHGHRDDRGADAELLLNAVHNEGADDRADRAGCEDETDLPRREVQHAQGVEDEDCKAEASEEVR